MLYYLGFYYNSCCCCYDKIQWPKATWEFILVYGSGEIRSHRGRGGLVAGGPGRNLSNHIFNANWKWVEDINSKCLSPPPSCAFSSKGALHTNSLTSPKRVWFFKYLRLWRHTSFNVLSLWEGLHRDGISCADQGEVHSLPSALGPESKMGKSLLIDMLTESQCWRLVIIIFNCLRVDCFHNLRVIGPICTG